MVCLITFLIAPVYFIHSIKEELTQGLSAPKRIKRDPLVARRPLRVHRFAGKCWQRIHIKDKIPVSS